MKRLALLALLLAQGAQAAIAFRSVGTGATGDAVTSIAPGIPAGIVSTDVVVASLAFGVGAGVTITPPAGWTLINRTNDGVNSDGAAAYWALGNVASFTFTISGLTSTIVAIASAYSGVDNVTPMDVAGAGQANTTVTTTCTAPSISTVTANTQLVVFCSPYDAARGNPGTWTAVFGTVRGSIGFRGAVDTADTSISDGAQAATGATGTKTETYSASMPNIGILAALRPAGAAAATPRRTLMGVGQ